MLIAPVTLDFVTDDLSLEPLDGILMANSLHFAADQPALTGKLKGYLKEDGCFLIAAYDTGTANRWVPIPA